MNACTDWRELPPSGWVHLGVDRCMAESMSHYGTLMVEAVDVCTTYH